MRRYAIVIIVAGSLLAVLTLQPGLDYFDDSGPIDSLVRGDWDGFFGNQPMMGPLSLFLRAPFVAAVFHSSLTVVYFAGVIPCLFALLLFARALWRRMARAGRGREDRILVALLCAGSFAAVRAVHWGHPEELLTVGLCFGALLAAAGERAVIAGLMAGAAVASKQWAVVAVLPTLLVLPAGRVAFLAACGAMAAALYGPMLLGDPERFRLVVKAAGGLDPAAVLGRRPPSPGAHVNPHDVWLPFASKADFDGQRLLFMPDTVVRFAHPFVAGLGVLLPILVWRRRPQITLLAAFRLLALILVARCALDPMSLDYYHLALAVALAGMAAEGGRRELDAALFAVAGLTLAFAQPAEGIAEIERFAALKFAVYMATVIPLAIWLAQGTLSYLRLPGETNRASRSPRAHASASSA